MTGAERFRFTTFRWANQQDSKGAYAKRPLMRKGFTYDSFTYGTDTGLQWRPFRPDWQPVQVGLVCSASTYLAAVDVDVPAEYAQTRTAKLLTREHAMSTRDDHFHVGIDMRGIAPARLAILQGKIPGGDIKAAGFVPLAGSVHYTGMPYAPHRTEADGWPALVPWTEQIVAALRADRDEYYGNRPARRGRQGVARIRPAARPRRLYRVMDHDTEQAGLCMRLVLLGLADPAIRAEWDKHAAHDRPDCDEDGAMGDEEFNRHLASARRKEAWMAKEEAARWGRSMRRALS